MLNVEEIVDIEKIIRLRRRCISKVGNTKNLEKTLKLRNLRIRDVPDCRNCFIHGVFHQLFDDIFSQ